jgi:hypothetical protein
MGSGAKTWIGFASRSTTCQIGNRQRGIEKIEKKLESGAGSTSVQAGGSGGRASRVS